MAEYVVTLGQTVKQGRLPKLRQHPWLDAPPPPPTTPREQHASLPQHAARPQWHIACPVLVVAVAATLVEAAMLWQQACRHDWTPWVAPRHSRVPLTIMTNLLGISQMLKTV